MSEKTITETMTGQIIEVGTRDDNIGEGCEFIVQVDAWGLLLHVPCTGPVARSAGSLLYEPMDISITLTKRKVSP